MVDKPPPGKPPVAKPPHVEEVEIDPRLDPEVQKKIVEAEISNAKNGRLVGFVVIVLGAVLTVLGATGAVNLNITVPGLSAKVTNAAPGVVLMIIGCVIIVVTNLRIKAARSKK